jgi:sugar lactone lactonase YvrE/pimeloyl-ACP methyl ester carboxylesterase
VLGTDLALDQVVDACGEQRTCADAYPHLRRAWNTALRRLESSPATFRDEDVEVFVDAATAVRYLRNNLAQGVNETNDLADFPWAVTDLLIGGWRNGGPAGDQIGWATAPPFHVGYDVQWGDEGAINGVSERTPHLVTGLFYSTLCHDELPFVDVERLARVAGDRPWYVDAYVDHPFGPLCDMWDAGAAESDPHAVPDSDVPVLMMPGRFDPYAPTALVDRAARRLPNGWVVEVPTRSRNVMATDCTIGIRDAFIVDPDAPPRTRCIEDLLDTEPVVFTPAPPVVGSPGPGEPTISTAAGDGAYGSAGDGGPATEAQLAHPAGLAIDDDGNLFVVELYGERVRVIDASGRISTAVGAPTGVAQPPPGDAAEVAMRWPTAVEVDADGNLYVGGGDGTHRTIIRIDPSGQVSTIVGTGAKGFSGDGGPATEAATTWIRDIAIDGAGNLYFSDFENNRVRMIDPSGIVATVAGTGEPGSAGVGELAVDAELDHPTGIAVDAKGNLYIADRNHRVLRIGPRGILRVIAGNGEPGYLGDGGVATEARIGADGIALDAAGTLYISDGGCACVRMVDAAGIITTLTGIGIPSISSDGVEASRAPLQEPAGLAVGPDGSVYIADLSGDRVRVVTFP